jgi:hypothetical protein
MKIEANYLRINHLFHDIKSGNVLIPSYQREYCWSKEKIDLFIDSLEREIPIGVVQFRKLDNGRVEVVDGLHRIRTLFNILLGKGIYFNFETCKFTTNPNDYDYSKFVAKDRLSSMNILKGMDNEIDFDISIKFSTPYEKIYHTELLKFEFSGTDEEVKIAFDRINEQGIAFTPVFNKVKSETILEI